MKVKQFDRNSIVSKIISLVLLFIALALLVIGIAVIALTINNENKKLKKRWLSSLTIPLPTLSKP